VSERRPADVTRELYSAWTDRRLDALDGLVDEDVVVSGYLADGRPLQGRAAVLEMVEAFSQSSGQVQIVEVEELDAAVALLQLRIGSELPDEGEGTPSVYWLWRFEADKLKESHAFASRDAALAWFGAQGDAGRAV
jgi:ketosteroid isomerase-like protein